MRPAFQAARGAFWTAQETNRSVKALKRKHAAHWALPAAAAALIVLIFASGVLRTQKTWPDVQLDYRDGKTAFDAADGDAYGVVASGPYYDLPAGEYRIQWQIEGDGENVIRLSCSNDVEITPSVFATTAGEWQGEAVFTLEGPAHSFSINVEFAAGTWMKAYNFRLYSPMVNDDAFTAAFALLAACLLYFLHRRGWLTAERRGLLLAMAAAVVFASIPSLQENRVFSWDVPFHAPRLMNIADGLRSGQFPVRVGGYSYNGYGAATSVFYPDLLLYPFAALLLGGASITYVLHVSCAAISALTAALTYGAARRLLRDRHAACCAAILYVCCVYRLQDMYMRYMLGEMLAMAFLPVFLLGLWEVLFGEAARWPLLMAGATLVFQSHMCTTLQCAALALVLCAGAAGRLLRERARLAALFKAITTTLLLGATTIVPLVTCYLDGANTPVMQFGFENEALVVSQLLSPEGPVGLSLWLGLLAALCALGTESDAAMRRDVRLFAVIGCAAAAMTTRMFPWGHVVALTGGLVEVIQFPWRLLVPAALMLSLCGGYGAARLLRGHGRQAALLTLVLAVVTATPYLESVLDKRTGIEFGQGANPFMSYPEYQFEGTNLEKTRSRQPEASQGVTIAVYEKDGTRVRAQVEAPEGGELVLPLFGFDGYRAELDGEALSWSRGDNNRLTLTLPAGARGELRVWFAGKALWRAADAVSLATAVWLLLWTARRRRRAHDV